MANNDAATTDTDHLTANAEQTIGGAQLTRRQVLAGVAAGAAVAFPTIIPARVLWVVGAIHRSRSGCRQTMDGSCAQSTSQQDVM